LIVQLVFLQDDDYNFFLFVQLHDTSLYVQTFTKIHIYFCL